MIEILKNRTFLIILSVVVIIAAIPAVYFYKQYKNSQTMLSNLQSGKQEELLKTVESVGKLMLLPADETPVLAVVSDKEKLNSQSFFSRAENGDSALIYPKAKKVILYRPSINKIIEVSNISINSNESTQAAAESTATAGAELKAPEAVALAIYNGTKTAGLAGRTKDRLKSKFPDFNTVVVADAKNNYSNTIVIDVSKKNKTAAGQLAAYLNAKVTEMPQEEKQPLADILIIIGSDSK